MTRRRSVKKSSNKHGLGVIYFLSDLIILLSYESKNVD